VQASFRDNYDQLAAIKHKYDPANLFRVNRNNGLVATTV
jgi:Berberine and berberine like